MSKGWRRGLAALGGVVVVLLIASQLLMLVVVIGYVLLNWPIQSWARVEALMIAMIFVSSIVSYPFAILLWIAVEVVSTKRE